MFTNKRVSIVEDEKIGIYTVCVKIYSATFFFFSKIYSFGSATAAEERDDR